MEFVGPNSVVQMTVQTLASNIIMAIGWIILGKCTIMQSDVRYRVLGNRIIYVAGNSFSIVPISVDLFNKNKKYAQTM